MPKHKIFISMGAFLVVGVALWWFFRLAAPWVDVKANTPEMGGLTLLLNTIKYGFALCVVGVFLALRLAMLSSLVPPEGAPSQLDIVWTCRAALHAAGVFPLPRFGLALAENPAEPAQTSSAKSVTPAKIICKERRHSPSHAALFLNKQRFLYGSTGTKNALL